MSEEALSQVFYEMCYFRADTCENNYLKEYAASLPEGSAVRDSIPILLEYFDAKRVDYFYCRYYKLTKNDKFENAALEYLTAHKLDAIRTQHILWDLVDFYIPGDLIKAQKWCELIRERDGLACELYKDCGMSDLGLELYPRNVILFLQCVDKMIDAFDESELWTENQKTAFEKYRKCLFSHRYIDFSFLIFEALQQIQSKPDVKKAISNIRYLIVDEYQDVNDLQEKVISEIANAGANICVVGDDDQTIYQFRGSNAGNMISFSKRYPHVKQVRLETNFRCSPCIVDIADTVISHNENRLDKKMQAGKNEKSCTEAIRYNSQSEEFAGIAHKIRELHHSGIPYGEISILVRKGKIIAPITAALDSCEIPYETDSAQKFFSGGYFSRFATTLQLLVDIDKSKLHDCWHDIVESTLLTKGFKYLRSCVRNGRMTLREILEGFCEQITFIDDSIEDCEERKENLAGITKILDDYDEIYGDWQLSARITGVLRFLAYQAEEEYKYHKRLLVI